jgi:hypothetical protein
MTGFDRLVNAADSLIIGFKHIEGLYRETACVDEVENRRVL